MLNVPRVTIVSAYYNRAGAVSETLNSISTQSYADWVAHIWDDCSTDDTWKSLQEAQSNIADGRITVHRQECNLGFVGVLNHACRVAQTEFVAIVGSGDVCLSERIAKQVTALDSDQDASFCTTAAASIDPDTGIKFVDNVFSRERIFQKDLLHSCPFTHGSVMFRRRHLKEVNYYDPHFTWSADWDLFNRLLSNGRHAIHLNEELYLRYARSDGASFSPKKSILQIKYAHLVHMLREMPEKRDEILDVVESKGLDAALLFRKSLIADDIFSRQAKLHILGRHEVAKEFSEEVATQSYPPTTKWIVILTILRRTRFLPLIKLYSSFHKLNQLRKKIRPAKLQQKGLESK